MLDLSAHLRDIGLHPVEGLEARARGASDDGGESRLSRARRSVKNEGSEAVGLNRSAQQFSLRENMLLTTDFRDSLRPQSRRERLRASELW